MRTFFLAAVCAIVISLAGSHLLPGTGLCDSHHTVDRLLSPVLQGAHRGKTVVVAAVNLGYTDMLLNWVLSARVAGADLSNLLIVAADEYAYSMAGCAGLTALYDPITFGTKFPTKDSGFAQGGFADMPVNRPLAPHLRPQLLCI